MKVLSEDVRWCNTQAVSRAATAVAAAAAAAAATGTGTAACHAAVCLIRDQVVEDGYEFFARRHLVTLFSAPNYCGEFDNAGAMMSVDDTLMCSFQASGLRRSLRWLE